MLGQFATPYPLALNILQYVKTLLPSGKITLLEPAIGTGVFYSAFLDVLGDCHHSATGFEVDSHYAKPAQKLWSSSKLQIHLGDFLRNEPPSEKKNSPY